MDTIKQVFKAGKFRMFTADTPPEEAKASFKKRFGYEPKYCEVVKNALWVGPIREKEKHV